MKANAVWPGARVALVGILLALSAPAAAQWVPLRDVSQVAAGGDTTCAVLSGGALKCWGNGYFGQLGNGENSLSAVPTYVRGLLDRGRQVAVGQDHACAVLVDGGVRCWGRNEDGQLGDGTTSMRVRSVAVQGLRGPATSVAAGETFSCALLVDGGVQCWGDNGSGQLGDGRGMDSLTPVSVDGLPAAVTTLAAGDAHVCALLDGGGVWCWGGNGDGSVGDGTTTTRLAPVAVALEGSAVSLAAGRYTCAVLQGGQVWCWGGRYGAFGSGSVRTSPERYTNPSFGSAVMVAAGSANLCALNIRSEVWCGETGWPSTIVGGIGFAVGGGGAGEVLALAAGNTHVCARLSGSEMKCWVMPGSRGFALNYSGQLGDGTTLNRYAPATVSGIDLDVSDVAGGDEHLCALRIDGKVLCQGENSYQQLGDSTSTDRYQPVTVAGLDDDVVALTSGFGQNCALLDGGGVRCWGRNANGELGNGSTVGSAVPVVVVGLDGAATSIVAGHYHTCAVTEQGAVQCWGRNSYGQLGDGTTQNRTAPVTVAGLDGGATSVAATLGSTCALLANGSVKCWGANNYGQLGDDTFTDRLTPVSVKGLDAPVTAISARYGHVCAVLLGGGVKCWGENRWGQLGNGESGSSQDPVVANRARAVAVSGLGGVAIAVAAGDEHTCALLADGSARCWGRGIYGQIGDGPGDAGLRLHPVRPKGLGGAVSKIASGGDHTCAVLTDGRLQCWGSNLKGQLGHRNYYWPSLVMEEYSPVLFADAFEGD